MSSKSYEKDFKDILSQGKDIKNENTLDLRKVMIPFSKISSKQREEYIYLGHEKIPFNTRHPTYQMIFRNEFAEAIRSRSKRFNLNNGSTRFSTSL